MNPFFGHPMMGHPMMMMGRERTIRGSFTGIDLFLVAINHNELL
jgi:hypothetical protein